VVRSFLTLALFTIAVPIALSQAAPTDADRDGLADVLETELLTQFSPHFMVSPRDCSNLPAEFSPLALKAVFQADNGTIYGQAFPRPGHTDQIELHFYHLWRTDCGEMGHALDAEHVSALVSRDGPTNWKALAWYAAAHEDTVCDRSQIARAAAVGAENHGPNIWISRGKHASFLNTKVCNQGCGGDDCSELQPVETRAVINLGEPSLPLNGATWVDDPHWQLARKMRRSDFSEVRIARLDQLPDPAILWADPPKGSYQGAIRTSGNTAASIGEGARATGAALTATDVALDLADSKTGDALTGATSATGRGLAKTCQGVMKALRMTAKKTGKALGAN